MPSREFLIGNIRKSVSKPAGLFYRNLPVVRRGQDDNRNLDPGSIQVGTEYSTYQHGHHPIRGIHPGTCSETVERHTEDQSSYGAPGCYVRCYSGSQRVTYQNHL